MLDVAVTGLVLIPLFLEILYVAAQEHVGVLLNLFEIVSFAHVVGNYVVFYLLCQFRFK